MKFTDKLLKRSLIHDVEIYPNFFSNIWKIPNNNQLFIYILWTDGNIPQYVYDDIIKRLSNYEIKFVDGKTISEYLLKYKPYLIGYNSFSFDDPLVKALIHNYDNPKLMDILWNITQWSIEGKGTRYLYNKYKYNECLKGIDVQRVSGLDRIYKPLKLAAANLRHDKIQDLPIKPGSIIKENKIADIVVYELNDIVITEKLLVGIPLTHNSPTVPETAYTGLLPAIDFRWEIGQKYNVDLLNSNKSNIGKVLSSSMYSKVSGVSYNEFKDLRTNREIVNYSDIILDRVEFKTKSLQDFLVKLKKVIFNYTEYNKIPKDNDAKKKKFKIENDLYYELELFNNDIIFATGGIHGVHSTEKIFIETFKKKLKDLDAASYYPYIYGKYGIRPEHLEHFTDFVWELINTRIRFKREGNKVFANGLKIAINMIFGSGSDDHSWLKDEKFLLGVTINGQLLLLMLAEELYMNEIYPYYFNTDGLSVYMHPDKNDTLNKIWKDWEVKTMMELEADNFTHSYIRDVNNFINIKSSGSIKLKGAYEYTGFIEKYGEFDLTGSFTSPIISYATVQYFTKGISIENTISNHVKWYPEDGIYDFCIAKKANKDFTNQLLTIHNDKVTIEEIQNSVRYYVSNSNQKLYKVKDKTDTELLSLVKKSNLKNSGIDNLYFRLDARDDTKGEFVREIIKKNKSIFIYRIKQSLILQTSPKLDHLHYDEFEAGWNITLFNDYYKSNDYNINYTYYIAEAQKLIDGIEKDNKVKKVKEQISELQGKFNF